jgi:DNA-binding CsgD family transcriptional regulator
MAGIVVESAVVSRRDLEALRWVGEQYAVRADQLAAWLGCNPRTVRRLLTHLREQRFAEARRLLVGEPAWVIPTVKGLRAADLSFGAWRPRLGSLAHVAAVTEIRLHVQSRSPESEWVCERTLAREKKTPREHLADAVVLLDGKKLAIEVELTVKSKRRTHAIIDELIGRYDAVLYYCAPGPRRLISELAAEENWPSLGVRDLPTRCQGILS